jgi:hypothetical protein
VTGLLARHRHAYFAFAIGDQVAGQVDGDCVEGAGEAERGPVVPYDRGAGVGAAGEGAGVKGHWSGDRELDVRDELAVDVQLGQAGGPLALREVRFPGGLELEAELMPTGPPSALAPLSDTTMISVLSNSPVFFRKSSRRPM